MIACALLSGAALIPTAPAYALDQATPDWPCIWRKVMEIDAATIWDGPALDTAKDWRNDNAVRELSGYVISRGVKIDAVEAAIKKFADGVPAPTRDQKLTELFAGALSRTNEDRKLIMTNIEKFHKRQLSRAKEIEKEGIVLPQADDANAKTDTAVGEIDKLSPEEEKMKWEIRVFQERQQNIPIACEIPQLMDERAGAVARAIRALMKN